MSHVLKLIWIKKKQISGFVGKVFIIIFLDLNYKKIYQKKVRMQKNGKRKQLLKKKKLRMFYPTRKEYILVKRATFIDGVVVM